jgi:uncharacterized cupin superfamily protein
MSELSDDRPAVPTGLILVAAEAPPRARQSTIPGTFAARVAGRFKRPLGDPFGITNFGVNHTRLAPGAQSSLRHAHSRQDELVYVLEGRPTLITDKLEEDLEPGMCVGWKAGTGEAHHLVNRTDREVVLLEIGDRTAGDQVDYPDDDLRAEPAENGRWRYLHKDGRPY